MAEPGTLDLLARLWWPGLRRGLRGATPAQILRVAAFGLLALFFAATLGSLFKPLTAALWRQPQLGPVLNARLLSVLFGLLFLLLTFSTVLALLNRLLYAEDADFFAASPLAPTRYLRLRLWQSVLSSAWMILLLWLPYLWALRRAVGAGWGWWLWGLLAPLPLAGLAGGLACLLLGALLTWLPGTWLRRGLFTAGAAAGLGALLALRLSGPERLADPTVARNAMDYLASLDALEPLWWPGTWAGRGVMEALDDPAAAALWWGLGMLAAAAAWQGALALWGPRAWELWWRGAEHGRPRRRQGTGRAFLGGPGRGLARLLLEREAVALWRAPGQSLQALLLGTLMLMFLLSLGRLPLQGDADLKAMLTLPVSTVAQVILLAVSARFAFPAGSLERPGAWLLRHAPVPAAAWWRARVALFSLLLLAMSVPLFVAVAHVMTPAPPVLALLAGQFILAPLSLAHLGSGLGIAWARPGARSAEEVLGSSAGVVAMVLGFLLLLLQHALLALPLREAAMAALLPHYQVHRWALGGALGLWAASHAAAMALPARMALRTLEASA